MVRLIWFVNEVVLIVFVFNVVLFWVGVFFLFASGVGGVNISVADILLFMILRILWKLNLMFVCVWSFRGLYLVKCFLLFNVNLLLLNVLLYLFLLRVCVLNLFEFNLRYFVIVVSLVFLIGVYKWVIMGWICWDK